MAINAETKLCLIIGDPVTQSLSPFLHNLAYQTMNLAEKFVYAAASVPANRLADAVRGIRALGVVGVSCTMPHKQQIMRYLDQIDPLAEQIGAVNTILNQSGKLIGFNTDWIGIVRPLEALTALAGKKVAILGAGGAARAACFGLKQRGCQVKLFNRTPLKAKKIARDFGCQAGGLGELDQLRDYQIIVNATPVGMHPLADQTPVPPDLIDKDKILFDSIYFPKRTLLLQLASQRKAMTISGLEMLLHQAAAQFEIFTGQAAPLEKMRVELNALLEK